MKRLTRRWPGFKEFGSGFDLPAKESQRLEFEKKMSEPNFWDNQEMAQKIVSQLSAVKSVIGPVSKVYSDIKNLSDFFELASSEEDKESLVAIEADLSEVQKLCEKIELQGLLSRPEDSKNCYFSIHAGAGGTESCDWVSMLLRMYSRFFELSGYKFSELDITPGEEVGIRSVTLNVKGPFAFGRLSCETGVHRLVRISPFDSQKRRHTSFAAVDCLPEFDEDIQVDIDDDDLRIDFYRAGGAGGQHVNKTSSAVRITHLSTGIVVQCQNERSQHKNKAQAMNMLKAKLYMLEQQKRDDHIAKLYGDKGEIAWGNQIRSYVFNPYRLVKDHRTHEEVGNLERVMDGDIDMFIDAYLKMKKRA